MLRVQKTQSKITDSNRRTLRICSPNLLARNVSQCEREYEMGALKEESKSEGLSVINLSFSTFFHICQSSNWRSFPFFRRGALFMASPQSGCFNGAHAPHTH